MRLAAAMFSAVLLATSSASGGLTPIGNPFDSNSWGHGFWADTGSYDHFQLEMHSAGDAFEVPVALTNFSNASWAQVSNSGKLVLAEGPRITSKDLTFSIIFAGAASDPLMFHFQAWDGNVMTDSADASWNGSAWSFSPCTWTTARIPGAVVPAPAAAGLVFVGLGLVGWFRRRFEMT